MIDAKLMTYFNKIYQRKTFYKNGGNNVHIHNFK